jgi:signal transduction histidine kinase
MQKRLNLLFHVLSVLFFGVYSSFLYGDNLTHKKDSLVKLLHKTSSETDKIKIYYQIGDLYFYNSSDSCKLYADIILQLAQKNHSVYGEGLGYITLGNGYFSHNDLAQTIHYYLLAQNKLEHLQPTPRELPVLLGVMVTAYAELMDYKTSLEYGERTLALAEKMKDSITLMAVHNNIGDLFDKQQKYKDALYYYEKALEMGKLKNRKFTMGIASYNIGHVYNMQGKYKDAVSYLQEAIAISKSINDTEGIIYNYIDLAQVALKAKKLGLAFLYTDSAFVLNQKYDNQKLKKDAYLLYSDIYHAKGNNDSAYAFLLKATSIKDSIYNESNQKLVYNLTTNQKIENLNNQALIAEKALNKQRTTNQILIIIGFVFFFASFFLLVINYQRKKHTTLLEDKNAQIEAQSKSLSALNLTKDRLISVISHDLRAPLNQIKAILGMFEENILSQADFVKISQKLKNQTDVVSDNLENVLHWANAQLKGNEQEKEQVYLDTYINEISKLYESSLAEKRIVINISAPKGLSIFIQKEYLKVVLRNLISNAIKFSHTDMQIGIEVEKRDNNLFIRIIDSGIGMNSEQIENILTKNQGFSTLGTLKEKGTGMGLRLSKEFIEKSGGRIEIASEIGKGTTFTVIIPENK